METFHTARVAQLANEDGEFLIAARFWDTRLRFDVGTQAHRLLIEGGRIAAFEPCPAGEPCDVRVAATPEQWDEILQSTPQAFYHDLYAAMARHGVSMSGSLEQFYPYYPAVRRLIELMRVAANEPAAVR